MSPSLGCGSTTHYNVKCAKLSRVTSPTGGDIIDLMGAEVVPGQNRFTGYNYHAQRALAHTLHLYLADVGKPNIAKTWPSLHLCGTRQTWEN
jgi:hypothetical protein